MVKRDPKHENLVRERYVKLMIFLAVLFVVLAGRLFLLQQVRYSYYAQYARDNQLQRERIVSPRGLIRDRNGIVLVDNVPRYDIVLPWRDEAAVRMTVLQLNRYLPLDTTRIFDRFELWKKRNRGLPFPLLQDADKRVISFVRENYDLFPKLRVETNARRRYRNDQLGAHLLGYVGEVTDQFLAGNRDYRVGDIVGKTGVEALCESYVRGKDGQRVVAVNAAGTVLGEVREMLEPPERGSDVTLTIDGDLQRVMEQLIAPHGAGAAVVMKVDDGAILTAVSLPQFDPNSFAMGLPREEWEALNAAPEKPLFNRFLQATYPPGSTLKIVSTYGILTEQIVPADQVLVYCTGAHRFGNRVFRCWKSWGHGYMDLASAFVQSCDSYFYEVAERMDVDVLADACRDFGLGSRSGIDLANETQGLVPDREYYDSRYGKGKWTQGLMLNNIIGQGELLTSVLQMCRVAAAVANGGYLLQPHVIQSIEGRPSAVFTRKRIRRLDASTVAFLQRVMQGVVQDEYGTGRACRIPGFQSAGKTGTAQNPHGEDHAWFVGFAPADAPEIALAILVENAGHGGSVAAPIARQFYEAYRGTDVATVPRAPANNASDSEDHR